MDYTNDTITWSVPKNVHPLSAGATGFEDVFIEVGVDLHKLSPTEIASRKYVVLNDSDVITIKIPIGAEGGYYKVSCFLHQAAFQNASDWGRRGKVLIL